MQEKLITMDEAVEVLRSLGFTKRTFGSLMTMFMVQVQVAQAQAELDAVRAEKEALTAAADVAINEAQNAVLAAQDNLATVRQASLE